MSAKELYLTSNPNEPGIDLKDIYPQFHFDTLDGFVRRLADYAAYMQRLGPAHPWAERVNFAQFNASDGAKADQAIAGWSQMAQSTNEQLRALLNRPLSLTELANWLTHDWEMTALLVLLGAPDATHLWSIGQCLRTNRAHPASATNESAFDALAAALDEVLAPPGPELTLQPIDRPAFLALVVGALTVRSSWIRWRWWQLTDPGQSQLQRVASANGLTLSEPDLQTLKTKVDKRVQLELLQQQAGPLLVASPVTNSPDGLRLLSRAKRLIERIDALPPLHNLPPLAWATHGQFTNVVRAVLTAATTVQIEQAACQTYLTDAQINGVWQDDEYAQTLRRTLRQDLDFLIEADRLKAGFSDAERIVTERLVGAEPLVWITTLELM